MASWYRRFIPHFAEIIEPLNRLLKRNKKWEWRIEQTQAINGIDYVIVYASRNLNSTVTMLSIRKRMFGGSMGD